MRITRIELSDFRAFAGSESFDLQNGRNLLVCGENGAGKSSLYLALREIFNLSSRARPFADFQHVFTQPPRSDGYVRLQFDDGGSPVEWAFGGERPSTDERIARGGLRIGCLDYRALLDTNYAFRDDAINLFDLLVEHVLAELPLTMPRGYVQTVRQAWKRAVDTLGPWRRYWTGAREQAAQNAALEFSAALGGALPAVEARANALLQRFPDSGIAIQLTFPGIQIDKVKRRFVKRLIELRVTLHGQPVPQPHHFLNEARLSAIALALYFAALLETVPPDPTWPHVLALDDVLIGLDVANRLPVLEILLSEFSAWQVFLLTHDQTWFEMVRTRVEGGPWLVCEMYRHNDPVTGADRPLIKPPSGFLQRARQQLAAHDLRAAAMYARAAFESKLRKFCSERSLLVPFKLNPAQVNTEDFLNAVERNVKAQGQWGTLGPRFHRVRMFRKVVLNPLTHAEMASIIEPEVRGAIDAIDQLRVDPAQGRPALDAAADLCSAAEAQFEAEACACCLRAAFEASLRDFCRRHNVAVPWRESTDLFPTRELWQSAKADARLRGPSQALLVNGIEAMAWLWLDELDATTLGAHAPADFRSALALLSSTGATGPAPSGRRTKLDEL